MFFSERVEQKNYMKMKKKKKKKKRCLIHLIIVAFSTLAYAVSVFVCFVVSAVAVWCEWAVVVVGFADGGAAVAVYTYNAQL